MDLDLSFEVLTKIIQLMELDSEILPVTTLLGIDTTIGEASKQVIQRFNKIVSSMQKNVDRLQKDHFVT